MSSRCSSSIWVTQLLLLAPSTEWQRERNKQMVWWKVGRLLSETVLANASLQCAHNCGLHRGVVVFLRVFLPGLFVASPWQFEVFLDLGVYPKTGKFLCFGSISYLSVLGEKLFGVERTCWTQPLTPQVALRASLSPRFPWCHQSQRLQDPCGVSIPKSCVSVNISSRFSHSRGGWALGVSALFGLWAGAGRAMERSLLLAVTITGNPPRRSMGTARMA